MDKFVLQPVNLLQVGNILEGDRHANTGDGRVLSIEYAAIFETDFVARNPGFKELAHDIALHIAAMRPLYLALDAVSKDAWQVEKERFEEEARALGKPQNIVEQIVDGKLKSYFGALALLEQPFVKDQDKTVGTIIKEAIGKFGENIKVGRFARLEI